MPAEDLQKLRQQAMCLLPHVFAETEPHDPMRSEIVATLERLDSPRAVQQVTSTLMRCTTGVIGGQLAVLDRELAALGFTTLSAARVQDRQAISRIIERGRIESRDENRIAAAFAEMEGPLGPSTIERRSVLNALNNYSEDDQESADTAPLALAWRAAARGLDIRFISPYRLSSPDQPEIWCCGLLPDFGGTQGTVILGRFSSSDAQDLAEQLGYYTSGLNPLYYERYERDQFEETLNDWGWFGPPSTAPQWFAGGIARHGGPEEAA